MVSNFEMFFNILSFCVQFIISPVYCSDYLDNNSSESTFNGLRQLNRRFPAIYDVTGLDSAYTLHDYS